jgi:hypothetical protein
MWIILFIVAGGLILGYSARLDEHSYAKPIVESIGDGLFLLGVIDLYLQNVLIKRLTKPSALWELNKTWKKIDERIGAETEKVQAFNRQQQLDRIDERSNRTEEAVEKILSEIKALRVQVSKTGP